MQQIVNPYPVFRDLSGDLIDAGYIYVGASGADPEVSPLTVYWDSNLIVPAAQPLRTRGGYIVNNGAPARVFTDQIDYSIRVRDADMDEVLYTSSASASGGVSFQPFDSDLTAIAAVGTQPFGRTLLTAATAAAARAILGIINWLSTAGGTVTGNILRSGAGPHLYHGNGAFTSGKITATVNTASDPTTADGEIWLKYAP